MTINTLPAQAINTISAPVFVPLGSIVTVTPNSGGTCVVEYSSNSANQVQNGTATWTAWGKGTITTATSDLTTIDNFVRIKPTVQPAVLSWDDQPTANAKAAFGSSSTFTSPVSINIGGGTPTTLTNPTFQATNNVNNFTQSSVQNKSAGASASADHICYPDNNANDITGFMDIGITSSTFSDSTYAITGANEGYVFASAPSGAGKSGNMVIATDLTGFNNAIKFYTGGFNSAANLRMTIEGTNNQVVLNKLGGGFSVKEGVNGKQGIVTLVAGTATVTTTVTANSRIFLTAQSAGGTVGAVYVSARTAGTSFTITSTSGADTSVIAYEIFEPSP